MAQKVWGINNEDFNITYLDDDEIEIKARDGNKKITFHVTKIPSLTGALEKFGLELGDRIFIETLDSPEGLLKAKEKERPRR